MENLKYMKSINRTKINELRSDRELAVEYLKCAVNSLKDSNERSAGLLVLRAVVETIATWDRDSTLSGKP